ncbi:MAG: TrmH family RNA methyltransferase [Varibaculum sp.]|nr:TrmH family RNA methyltransferase [Varibaculum sp.]
MVDDSVGVGPWPGGHGAWPDEDYYDPVLLAEGDRRNVEDRFRYWKRDAIRDYLDTTRHPFEVAIENLDHDFNIGSIVRTANAFAVARVHIVGKHRWNRRGAMVTDRYQHVDHFQTPIEFAADARARDLEIIGIDNVPGSVPIENHALPKRAVLVFGSESRGLSEEMQVVCREICHIKQYGSTRSINVGHAAAIAMWAWIIQHA